MIIEIDQKMCDYLPYKKYIQIRSAYVPQLIVYSIMNVDAFTIISCEKTFDQKIKELSTPNRATQQEKTI